MASTTLDLPTARYLRVVGLRSSGAAGRHADRRARRQRTRQASKRAALTERYW